MDLSDTLSEELANVVKQETDAGTWIPYLGPDDGEGWQNTEDPEDIRYGLDEPPGEVAEGYDRDHWDSTSGRVSDFENRIEEKVSEHDEFHRQHYAIQNELKEEIKTFSTFLHDLPKFRDNIEMTKDLASSLVQADEHGLLDGSLSINNSVPGDAHAEYWFTKNSLSFNNNFDKEELEKYHEKGQFVGDDIEALVLHELGHHLHQMEMEESDSDLSEFGDNLISHRGEWNEDFFYKVDEQVSSYARHEPTEFVAEVFSGLCLGINYDDEIMERYNDYGGSDDWQEYRESVHPDGPKVPRKDNRDIDKSLPKPFLDEAETVWESFVEYVESTEEGASEYEKQVSNVTGEWVPYQGPRGGEGWQRVSDQEVVYQDDPPGDTVEGVEESFWERFGDDEEETQDPSGYYDPEVWDDAFPDMAIDSPSDVPEGTQVHYQSAAGNHFVGRVTGYQYGRKNPEGIEEAYLEVTSEDGYEAAVPARAIEEIQDLPHEEESIPEFEWDTDVPRIDELQEGADVLYEGENGVRRVGQYERPTFVQTDEGTFGGAVLEDGTEIRLQDMIAVDEGPVPLEPRDDPYEFDSVLREEDMFDMDPWVRENVELWENKLEFTPFDDLGEVPLGAEVEFDNRKVNDPVVGEVTGYVDYDASIGETNSLRVETDNEYIGETTVGPSNFRRFIGPEGDQDLTMKEYLHDPFEYAVSVKSSRQAGITEGNTTGEDMKILEMPDDSRVFATPLDAYQHISTGIVDSPEEAKENNLHSPIMIEHLGGGTCATEVVEGPDGKEYIAKEGIGGDKLQSHRFDITPDKSPDVMQALEETFAAAYFVGNTDLHGANVKVNMSEGTATIIDHDAAGGTSLDGWMDVSRLTRNIGKRSEIRQNIYEIVQDYMNGELDVPDEVQGTKHESYFKSAVDAIVNDENHVDAFEPWEGDPHSLPRHADSMDDFTEGQRVTVLSSDGRVRTGELTDYYQGTWYGETEDGYEISFDMPHHVLSSEEPQVPIEPTEESQEVIDALNGEEESEYDEITDLEPGMGITIDQGFGEEEVVVEEIDSGSPFPQMLVRPTDGGDEFHVNHMDDVVRVGRGDSE